MKASKATATKKEKPFYKDENIEVLVQEENEKIVAFKGRNKKVTKVFKVKGKILAAFKELENFFANI